MGGVSADQLMKHITDAGGSGFQVSLVTLAIAVRSDVREKLLDSSEASSPNL